MIDIRVTTAHAPRVPFERITSAILGTSYALSLVVCGDTLARRVNTLYRKKTYSPNVLSFPLSNREGEIFLNIRKAAREASSLKKAEVEWCTYLFIHACLHLKGHDHGSRMDTLERQWMRRSGFPRFTHS